MDVERLKREMEQEAEREMQLDAEYSYLTRSSPIAEPPVASRVAARALVLASMHHRGILEMQEVDIDSLEEMRENFLPFLENLGISEELEDHETALLRTPVGRCEEQALIDACWRDEGLAVLAWALGRNELPRYDEASTERPLQSVGWANFPKAEELLASAVLRSRSEIKKLASHMTVVNWRVTEFRIRPGRMDYVGYLRAHPFFKESWLEDLCIIDDDLAISGQAIADAPVEAVQDCVSIILERTIAVYWLEGDDETYSNVRAHTYLTTA
jgi:hypothetical protein